MASSKQGAPGGARALLLAAAAFLVVVSALAEDVHDNDITGAPVQLQQVPGRRFQTGLLPGFRGLGSAANITRASYSSIRSQKARLDKMRLGATPQQIAQSVCCANDLADESCRDPLLLALTPAAYSSNNTAHTPRGRAFISPAQNQLQCQSCVGFTFTAAAEAAVNVYMQQNQDKLSLSEQDLNVCKLRINCAEGTTYGVTFLRLDTKPIDRWASRKCLPYSANPSAKPCSQLDKTCPASQLPPGGILSVSYNAAPLTTMAMVKERIMLSGGVMTSMAMTNDTYRQFEEYNSKLKKDIITAPQQGADEDSIAARHAVFCYGWEDNPQNNEDGYWRCKNSWSPAWGFQGSFKIAYGSAFIMPPDTYALEFYISSYEAHATNISRSMLPSLADDPTKPGCLKYRPPQPQRLIKLVEDLTVVLSQVSNGRRQAADTGNIVLADVVTFNRELVKPLSAVGKGPFLVCGKTAVMLNTVMTACPAPPQQQSFAAAWQGCGTAAGSTCSARCSTGTGAGYQATCVLSGGTGSWQVTGSCTAACDAAPPKQANAVAWGKCSTALQSTCSVQCSRGATGDGYKAVCTAVDGSRVSWEVTGSCVPGGSTGGACTNPPQQQPNGMPWTRCGTAIDSSCATGCSSGATGGYQATCIATNDGKATWQYFGSCAPAAVRCPGQPQQPPNTISWPTCDTAAGTICYTACTAGFTGRYTAICTSTGSWSFDGSCQPVVVRCPGAPQQPPNTVSWPTCDTVAGSSCATTCTSGFTGSYKATCLSTGSWSFEGSCQPVVVRCPGQPQQPPNTVTWPTCDTVAGTICSTTCASGFKGGYSATCTSSGTWSISGSCTAVPSDCSGLPAVQANSNGWPNCNTAAGSSCSSSCRAGTVGSGYTATCVAAPASGTATWFLSGSGCEVPVIRCSPTPQSPSYTNPWQGCGTAVGSTCSAPCSTGYTGGYSATCTSSGTWSLSGNCQANVVRCPGQPQQPSNTVTWPTCDTVAGTICSTTCASGFTGSYKATCTSSGSWFLDGSCQQDACGPFSDASTGVSAACVTIMWTEAGCTKVDNEGMPSYYWRDDWWLKATKAAIASDIKLWATSAIPDRVAACKGSYTAPAEPPGYSCLTESDVAGTDIGPLWGVDEGACTSGCDADAQCAFYVYKKNGECWLKKDYNNGPNGWTGGDGNVARTCRKTGICAGPPNYDPNADYWRNCGTGVQSTCKTPCFYSPGELVAECVSQAYGASWKITGTCSGGVVRRVRGCETTEVTVQCDDGYKIKILAAYYGHYDDTACTPKGYCKETDIKWVLKPCNEYQKCNIPPNTLMTYVPDPCVGVSKEEIVDYSCYRPLARMRASGASAVGSLVVDLAPATAPYSDATALDPRQSQATGLPSEPPPPPQPKAVSGVVINATDPRSEQHPSALNA
ncbi:hypothetical protein OEZ85_012739 [Tetradesmus obliquus]|uniref:Peptidase C1A papain C-terminal domain-containing protein n=1 Tax=Tetradesmus obliquus TaxID=3088 RepID=A0ABY8U7M8_TETOB|nr:hypothetical protein OEZ85_012739 [Tetradesmus obliquus]